MPTTDLPTPTPIHDETREGPSQRPELPEPIKDPMPEIPDADKDEQDEQDMPDPDKRRRDHPEMPDKSKSPTP